MKRSVQGCGDKKGKKDLTLAYVWRGDKSAWTWVKQLNYSTTTAHSKSASNRKTNARVYVNPHPWPRWGLVEGNEGDLTEIASPRGRGIGKYLYLTISRVRGLGGDLSWAGDWKGKKKEKEALKRMKIKPPSICSHCWGTDWRKLRGRVAIYLVKKN